MYYEDLTPYDYWDNNGELNVGWLEKRKPFNSGIPSNTLLENLKLYDCQSAMVHQTRGWQLCEFCEKATSSNEIRVFGADGKAYASPYMIIHYIKEHGYLPPTEFIEAVINGPKPESKEYKKLISKIIEL